MHAIMEVHLSFDYELFFGSSSGTLINCIIKPTQQLVELGNKYNVKFIFFVDAGYIYHLKKYLNIKKCSDDFDQISKQIKQLYLLGHEIGLHIHPHWEDCKFENNEWNIITSRYKLANFNENEIDNIVTKYHQAIISITGMPCKSLRAGGWCVQPFNKIKKALITNNLKIDSSVYQNGFHNSQAQSYDFRNAPSKTEWQFDNDPCLEVINGEFREIAITPDIISPFFYWKLYFNMRTNPLVYVPVGDGKWLSDKKRMRNHFYTSTHHFACADGFFASRLISIFETSIKLNKNKMMVLSHPKSLAPYSFLALEKFIQHVQNKQHTFNII